jgi:hypothetical protein
MPFCIMASVRDDVIPARRSVVDSGFPNSPRAVGDTAREAENLGDNRMLSDRYGGCVAQWALALESYARDAVDHPARRIAHTSTCREFRRDPMSGPTHLVEVDRLLEAFDLDKSLVLELKALAEAQLANRARHQHATTLAR